MLKKVNWPLMNADERGFEDAKAFVFNLRLSAFISGQPCFLLFQPQVRMLTRLRKKLLRAQNGKIRG
jgi:hypothetical protein